METRPPILEKIDTLHPGFKKIYTAKIPFMRYIAI